MVRPGRKPTSEQVRQRGAKLADALRQHRERQKRSRFQLAKVAGVDPETLRRIESHQTVDPGFFTVVDLADALGLDMDDLAGRTRL